MNTKHKIELPQRIRDIIGERHFELDAVGMSSSQVYCFEDMVLKVEETGENSNREYQMMQWLQGRLPVPKVIAFEQKDGYNYLLMSKIEGEMSCSPRLLEQPEKVVRWMVEGLKLLWSINPVESPIDNSLDHKLLRVREAVENGLVDTEDAEEGTFGEGGFKDPEELLHWLETHRPEEDLVFSHGDYCMPNVFIKNDMVTGFIDLGNCGVADRYQDIALCYRTLLHNYQGKYAPPVNVEFDPNMLFDELDIKPDWDKVKYYILLDELF